MAYKGTDLGNLAVPRASYAFKTVASLVLLEQGIGVVVAGPGQLGPASCFKAEGQGVPEVLRSQVRTAHGLGYKKAVKSQRKTLLFPGWTREINPTPAQRPSDNPDQKAPLERGFITRPRRGVLPGVVRAPSQSWQTRTQSCAP